MKLLVPLCLLLAACPPERPPVNAATLTADKLPNDVKQLIETADKEFEKLTQEGAENAVIALDKAAGIEPQNIEVLWRLARAHGWLSEELDGDNARVSHAEKGIAAAEKAVGLDKTRIEPIYWLALNRGEYVNVRREKAMDRLPGLVEAGKAAMKLDEKYENCGPLRLVGSVLAQAPEPPTSIGDHEEGLKMLERAVQLCNNYAENHLELGDGYKTSRKLNDAEAQYNLVLQMGGPPKRVERWHKRANDGLIKIRNLRRPAPAGGNPF
jgi:tetratricopeptide (TPR) repeat protein